MEERAAGAEKAEPGDSEQDDEDDVYEVEKIIDMRMLEGQLLYRVRWKNYTSDDDTWEPEEHLEDCREVLLAYRRRLSESKARKDAAVVEEAREVGCSAVQERQLAVASRGIVGTQEEEEQVEVTGSGLQRAPSPKALPMKSDLFDADSECDGDKRDESPPKKKKKKDSMDSVEDCPPEVHMKEKKKKKDKQWRQEKVLLAPESDQSETEGQDGPPAPSRSQRTSETKRAFQSDDDEEVSITHRKRKKDKPKDGEKYKKEKAKDGEKHVKEAGEQKKRKESQSVVGSPEDKDEWAITEGDLSEASQEDSTATESSEQAGTAEHACGEEAVAPLKTKQKQGRVGLKLQGIRDLIQGKKSRKAPPPPKETTHQRLKNLISSKSHSKTPQSSMDDEPGLLSSDSSDVTTSSKRKNKGKAQREPASPSSSSAAVTPKVEEAKQDSSSASSTKGKNASSCSWPAKLEDGGEKKEKDHPASTNLFEKFLLSCEAKDRVSRRQNVHPSAPENRVEQAKTTAPKTMGKPEKKPKPSKELLGQNLEPDRTDKFRKEAKASEGELKHFQSPETPWPEQSPTTLEAGEKQERREKTDSQAMRREKSQSLVERPDKTDNHTEQEKAEEVPEARAMGDATEKPGETHEHKERGEEEQRESREETWGGRGGARAAEAASPDRAEEAAAAGRMRERRRRREDSEPRLYIACDDNQDPQDLLGPADRTDRGQTSLSFGVDLKLNWMSLEDFQKHLNGEDEIFSAATLTQGELREAVKTGDYLAVKFALNSKEDYNLEQEDSSGMSLAMLAAAGGQDDILRLLIKKGAKVNGRQKNGTTALMHAAEKNFLSTVGILLEAGAYVNAQTLGGETALMRACRRGNADVVRLLLEHGANCNILSKHQNSALHSAKLSNNVIVYDYVKDHVNTLSSVAEETIRAYFETRLTLLEPVFPLACHRLCEGPDFALEFNYKPPQHSPAEGTGILLFIFHANFLSEITARLCGPCSVHAVVLNDKFQLPIFLDSHFIYSFSPVQGPNKLFIRLAESPTAKVKLLICAYRVQLQ